MSDVRTQTIFADDLEAGDSFVLEGIPVTAIGDAYHDDMDYSLVYVSVVLTTFGGMQRYTIARLRGDQPVSLISF